MSIVKLVAATQPLVDGVTSGEEFVAYCARVSNPGNQLNHGTAPKLLIYLTRNQHWSPFEMASVTMEIQTTRDIARQILRHRSFSFQEFSQRYAEVQSDAVYRGPRMQHVFNRQSSNECQDSDIRREWFRLQHELNDHAQEVYNQALAVGIAKEVARAVLPEGLTPSKLYMAGSIRSWIHYIQLRAGNGTQKEHRQIAEQCRTELLKLYPSLEEILNATQDH